VKVYSSPPSPLELSLCPFVHRPRMCLSSLSGRRTLPRGPGALSRNLLSQTGGCGGGRRSLRGASKRPGHRSTPRRLVHRGKDARIRAHPSSAVTSPASGPRGSGLQPPGWSSLQNLLNSESILVQLWLTGHHCLLVGGFRDNTSKISNNSANTPALPRSGRQHLSQSYTLLYKIIRQGHKRDHPIRSWLSLLDS